VDSISRYESFLEISHEASQSYILLEDLIHKCQGKKMEGSEPNSTGWGGGVAVHPNHLRQVLIKLFFS
jgi:hypothetical protein